MTKKIIAIAFCILLGACIKAQIPPETPKEEQKVEIEKYPTATQEEIDRLIFKTNLSEEEKAYFAQKEALFNEKVKQFAIGYGPEDISDEEAEIKTKALCKWLFQNIEEISTKPVSIYIYREREREREDSFLKFAEEKAFHKEALVNTLDLLTIGKLCLRRYLRLL